MSGLPSAIVFLDIDGVLNNASWEGMDVPFSCDPVNVRCLNELLADTGAQVVIISEWRRLISWARLCEILERFGVCAAFYSKTPVIERDGPHDLRPPRGYEVDAWLRQHQFEGTYVILDDRGDHQPHLHRLIQTDPRHGLIEEHIERAMRLLSGETVEPVQSTKSALWQNVRDEEL